MLRGRLLKETVARAMLAGRLAASGDEQVKEDQGKSDTPLGVPLLQGSDRHIPSLYRVHATRKEGVELQFSTVTDAAVAGGVHQGSARQSFQSTVKYIQLIFRPDAVR